MQHEGPESDLASVDLSGVCLSTGLQSKGKGWVSLVDE